MKSSLCVIGLIFFLLISTISLAQSRVIDSLKSILTLSGGRDDYKTMWELAFQFTDIDNSKGVVYARMSYNSANKFGDSLYIVKSARIMGQLLRRVDKLDSAIEISNKVLPISERKHFHRERRMLLSTLAKAYSYKSEYDTALFYYLKELKVTEENNDHGPSGEISNNIGFIYYKLENPELALRYYQKSLKAKFDENSLYDLDRLYVNMGLCYCALSDQEKAWEFFNKALMLCSLNCRNDIEIEANFGMGTAARLENKNYLARLYFSRSLELASKFNSLRFQLENLINLAQLEVVDDQFSKAENYLNQIESISDRNSYPILMIEFYKMQAELSEYKGDFKRSNFFMRKYIDYALGSFHSRLRNNFIKIETQFAERENLKTIEVQSKMLALQNESIRNHRFFIISLAISFVLASSLVFFLLKRVKEKQEINSILDQKVRQRTIELEKNRDAVMHLHNEQIIVLKKVTSDLVAFLATIKGLSNSGSLEITEGREKYYNEAKLMEQKLGAYVHKHLLSN